ncbi:MAG: SBBP repeat-containing protein [Planctomycetota bacterium]|jgi:hypothetical protein
MTSQTKNSITFAIINLLLLCSSVPAAIIPSQQWQASYGTSGPDYAYAMAVDDSGNVYVTGFTSLDMGSLATIKYGSDGNEVWARHRMFFAPVSLGLNASSSLMVDGLGNAYVSVATWHAIIKYDTNGDELWMSWYDDPELGGEPVAHAMAIDNQGNTYLTGECYYDDTGYDYATIAFDPNGKRLWRARYNSSGDNADYAAAVAVDEMQNVYVTGNRDTIKYDPNGSEVWVIPANGQYLAVDALGNIHLTEHGATDLYSPEGTIIWHLLHHILGPHTFDPHEVVSSCLEVDSMSNTLVLDSVDNGSNMDFVATKIDAEGYPLWQNSYTICGSSAGNSNGSLWIDAEDNIYIFCSNDRDYLRDKAQAVIKYDTDGNTVWTMRPGNTDPDWMDVFNSMAVDDAGNVYLGGSSFDWNFNRFWDYKTVKYAQRQANIYKIAASAGPNGSIDPNGPTLVDEQQTVQFTATPDSGYLVDKWYLDGAELDTFGPVCTLESVDANHDLNVTFKDQIAHLVTSEILGDYSPDSEPALILISGSSADSVSVEPGDNLHFKVFPENPPDPNIYTVDKWYLDGAEAQNGGLSYDLYDINADHIVGVTLKQVPEDFVEHTALAGANGSILFLGVDWFEAQADPGYVVDEWYLDGVHVQNGLDSYEFHDNQSRQIQVTFAEPFANLEVFAAISRHWGRTDCWGPVHCKGDCFDADLNLDHSIDAKDLAFLTEFWLQPVTAHGIQTLIQYEKVVFEVRWAIDMFRMFHLNDALPGAYSGSTFENSLTGCTDYSGRPVSCTDPDALGPYLQRIPWNPFSSVSFSVRIDGVSAGAGTAHWRFDSYLGMFERDDTADHELPVAENWNLRLQAFLQSIRDAIMLYKYEHCNTFPTYGGADFEECMTQVTNEAGDVWVEGVSTGSRLGPYLRQIPVNPFNGLNTVGIDGVAGDDTHGWHFDSENGNFQFDDSEYSIDGIQHADY